MIIPVASETPPHAFEIGDDAVHHLPVGDLDLIGADEVVDHLAHHVGHRHVVPCGSFCLVFFYLFIREAASQWTLSLFVFCFLFFLIFIFLIIPFQF